MTGTTTERRLSGRLTAMMLGLLALVSAVGAVFPYTRGMIDPVRPYVPTAGFVILTLLAIGSAILQLVHHRRAETMTAVTILLGVALSWASVTNGWWYYAPVLQLLVLGVIVTFAYRLMVRDENRHVSRDDTHALGEGPTHRSVTDQQTARNRWPRGNL